MNITAARRTIATVLIAAVASTIAIVGMTMGTATAASAAEPTAPGTVTVFNYGPSERSITVTYIKKAGGDPIHATVAKDQGVTFPEAAGDRIWVNDGHGTMVVNTYYTRDQGWRGQFADSTGVRGDESTGYIVEVGQL